MCMFICTVFSVCVGGGYRLLYGVVWAGHVCQCVPVLYVSVCTGVPAYVYRCSYYISCFINYPFLVGASPESPLQSSIHHSLESLNIVTMEVKGSIISTTSPC